ncbi:hypothetical protein [Dyadobacter luticola]|uniref:Uncharacterized protein n=1 Tax=Dyadobacter luticola TaxID=1979387 RepID=A0A5R9KVI4_9BACT|nr:hypothetical protein [Dyadobacter luticola]TLV00276.1 hypothetical protein FEN17_12290 [Dyadobacter luticola]
MGRDKVADDWLWLKYDSLAAWPKISKSDFQREYHGYYVLELATEFDGLSVYLSGVEEINVFRAQFLKDTEDLIGTDLFELAWETQFASQALIYAERVSKVADKIADKNNLLHLKTQRLPPNFTGG